MSRLIIREPSGALIGNVVSNVAGTLIGRVLSDAGHVDTEGVDGSSFCFLGFLHMDVDGYDDLLYFLGFPLGICEDKPSS